MINTLIKGNVPVTTIKQVQNMTLDVFMAKIMANEELFLNDLMQIAEFKTTNILMATLLSETKKMMCHHISLP